MYINCLHGSEFTYLSPDFPQKLEMCIEAKNKS